MSKEKALEILSDIDLVSAELENVKDTLNEAGKEIERLAGDVADLAKKAYEEVDEIKEAEE